MPMKLTERDVTRQVRDFLEAHGWRAVRMQVARIATVSGGFEVGELGMPDYLFLRYEADIPDLALESHVDFQPDSLPAVCQALWVEVKALGKRLSPAQVAWHQAERWRGATIVVADDLDEFQRWYKSEIGY